RSTPAGRDGPKIDAAVQRGDVRPDGSRRRRPARTMARPRKTEAAAAAIRRGADRPVTGSEPDGTRGIWALLTVIDRVLVAWLFTETVKVKVPAARGEPVMCPSPDSISPGGRELPGARDHCHGAPEPPVACRVAV